MTENRADRFDDLQQEMIDDLREAGAEITILEDGSYRFDLRTPDCGDGRGIKVEITSNDTTVAVAQYAIDQNVPTWILITQETIYRGFRADVMVSAFAKIGALVAFLS